MPVLSVDDYTLTFPEGWSVAKYDNWSYYKSHFSTLQKGIKAVDVIAVSPDQSAYLIEFKDYRNRKRDKVETIDSEFVGKTVSTLAAMLPATCNARDVAERELAGLVLKAKKIRLVLHLDQSRCSVPGCGVTGRA